MLCIKQSLRSFFILFSLSFLLFACGGSDDGPDRTPDAFSFTPATDVARNTVVTSNQITVSGISADAGIIVTGGEYAVAGGAFTSAAGTVGSGQTIAVRATSADAFATTSSVTLTIGGVVGTFSITTEAQDTMPDAFAFTDASDVEPSALTLSDVITVMAINDVTDISITGGEYAIDGGAFTAAAGTVSVGQTVQLRGTASAALVTAVDVVLSIGGVSDTFTITTFADTSAPTAEIHFPPAASLTEATTITVRGVASDAYSEITRVQVNGVDATATSAGFATWEISVDLSAGENALVVSVEDELANADETADQATVTQGAIDVAFPNNDVSVSGFQLGDVELYTEDNSLLLAVSDLVSFPETGQIISIDLATGIRTVFSDNNPPNSDFPLNTVNGIAVVSEVNRIYAATSEMSEGEVWSIDTSSGIRTLLSSNTFPNPDIEFGGEIGDVEYDSVQQRILIADFDNGQIVAIDPDNGARSVFTDGSGTGPLAPFDGPFYMAFDPNSGNIYVNDDADGIVVFDPSGVGTSLSPNVPGEPRARGLALDADMDRLIVSDNTPQIIEIDMFTGTRTVISNNATPNPLSSPNNLVIDQRTRTLFVSDGGGDTLFAVDADSGERVILSKSI